MTDRGVLIAEVRNRFRGVVRAVVGHAYMNGYNACECGESFANLGRWTDHIEALRAAGAKDAHLHPQDATPVAPSEASTKIPREGPMSEETNQDRGVAAPQAADAEPDGRVEMARAPDPFYSDPDNTLTLYLGDASAVLSGMESDSVNCIVTSPPYFGLRDYCGNDQQIGMEDSPAEYVSRLVEVFRHARRVLAEDGTLWLNLGDSYYSGRGNPGPNSADKKQVARRGWVRPVDRPGQDWAKPKDLLGIPWRTAIGLQDDGWYLRNSIVWHKPNAMPESIQDRLAGRHENLFLLTKSRRYWFDLDAIREPHADSTIAAAHRARKPYQAPGQRPNTKSRPLGEKGKNPGDVWSINTRPFVEAHFATFPVELPRRCILAGCKPNGVVLDPFSGAGTTALAAQQVGRRAIGIDINPEYHSIALKRMSDTPIPFGFEGEAS